MILDILHFAGGVARYHGRAGIRTQTNADHSWGVSVIMQHFYPDCSKEMLLSCLYHDIPEYITGDIPGPLKRKHPKLKAEIAKIERGVFRQLGITYKLTAKEEKILKVCDLLELVLYLEMLHKEGNILVGPLICKSIGFMWELKRYFSPALQKYFDSNLKHYLED